jgi:hypothetical protein
MKRLADLVLPLLTVVFGISVLALLAPSRIRGGEMSPANAGGGVVAFGRSVVVSQPTRGDVEVLGGRATISSRIDGDVVVLGGDIDLLPGAVIAGDVIAVGGTVHRASSSRVSGRIVEPGRGYGIDRGSFSPADVERHPLSFFAIALKTSLLLIWLLVAVVVTLVNGREVRSSSLELRVSFFHTLLVGLVAFTSFVLTALLFSYLVGFFIGLPLLVLLFVFAIMTKAYGLVAVFHAVGTLAIGRGTHAAGGSRRWLRGDLAMVVAGLIILGAIRLIPVIGTIVWIVASLLAVGTALGTRFGRREPWFLAWRPLYY